MSFVGRPSWRRERAEEYANAHLRFEEVQFSPKEDACVRKLTEYLMTVRANRALTRMEKRRRFPKIQEAFEIFSREDAFSDKWTIEALALSDLTYAQIADYTTSPPAVVEMYCLIFFDIRQPAVREKYCLNLRRAISGESNIASCNYGWKFIVVTYGVEIFSKMILNRSLMGGEERTILQELSKNAAALTSWWATEKRALNPDRVPSELELAFHKQNIETGQELAGKRDGLPGSGSCISDVLDGILGNVEGQVELLAAPDPAASGPDEKRLT